MAECIATVPIGRLDWAMRFASSASTVPVDSASHAAVGSSPARDASVRAPVARSRAAQGWALGVAGVFVFALSIPMTRLATGSQIAPQLPPYFVAFGRAALAGLLAGAWLLAIRAARPRPRQWPPLVLSAAGVVFGFPLFMGLAVRRVDAVHASVVSGLLPIATALMGAWLLRQRPGRGFWACAGTGTALVLGFAAWKGAGAPQAGDALLLAAVACAGFGYVQGTRLSVAAVGAAPAMPPEQVISWVLVVSLPLTLPLAVLTWPEQPVRPAAWGALAYLSVFSMWLGFFAWYRGLAWGGMMRVSQVQLLQPFLSMAVSAPLLGEVPDAATLLFALAVLGMVLLSRTMPAR